MTCHDPSSRSWYVPSRLGQRHHDRDLKHREPNMSNRVISGPLTIHVTIVSKRLQLVRSDVHSLHAVWDAHDRDPASWVRDQVVFFIASVWDAHDLPSWSWAYFSSSWSTSVFKTSFFSISGTLTIRVTIVSLSSQLVNFKSFISNNIWAAHDLMSRSWACNLSSWPYFA